MEILSATKSQPHAMTPFAKVEGQRVTYPATSRARVRLTCRFSAN